MKFSELCGILGLQVTNVVHTGLEKSWKIEKLWDVLEKSLNFPQKSLNIFESSLNENNLREKKTCFAQRND